MKKVIAVGVHVFYMVLLAIGGRVDEANSEITTCPAAANSGR